MSKILHLAFQSVDVYAASVEVPDDFPDPAAVPWRGCSSRDEDGHTAAYDLISERGLDCDENMDINIGGIEIEEAHFAVPVEPGDALCACGRTMLPDEAPTPPPTTKPEPLPPLLAHALDVMLALQDWDAGMGGHDAPAWADCRALTERLMDLRDGAQRGRP